MAERKAPAVAALLAAAGSGERLGRGPKAFVAVAGRTLLEWSLAAFDGRVDEIVIAVAEEDVERALALAPGTRVVPGGATRQQTVARLVAGTDADVVLVHDVARPFLPGAVIARVLEGVARVGAASAALPVVDTIVDAVTGETLDRARLRAVQTPQGFHRALLEEAHRRAASHGVVATDDAALVRSLGHNVALVEGSALLHKITTPEDLVLAPELGALWREQRHGPA